MPRPLSLRVRNVFAAGMMLLLVASLLVWWWTRDTLPPVVRVASAVEGGQYHTEAERLVEALERRAGRAARVAVTSGSQENAQRLLSGEVDAALVQAGSVALEGMAVVTTLHHDVVHVVVRRELLTLPGGDGSVRSVADLTGRKVVVGLPDSGMQKSATAVLDHYGAKVDPAPVHFTALADDPNHELAAAIVTTGVENGDLRSLLRSGQFGLLPLDAEALSLRSRNLEPFTIPANLWPPVPVAAVETVATPAVVVVREGAPSRLVTLLLDAIYRDDLSSHFTTVLSLGEALDSSPRRLHPATRRYHDPYSSYGVLHTILEGLAAGKELVVALGAAIYLLWDRWRRLREREEQSLIREQAARLDKFLERTLDVERKQIHVDDPEKLQRYLDDVTEIKLQALSRLTHEGLRSDRKFAIFLMQCANLISKIQLKIMNATRGNQTDV